MKLKEGDVLVCELEGGCGIELKVTKICGCEDCDVVCCGKQMKKKTSGKGSSCCGPKGSSCK